MKAWRKIKRKIFNTYKFSNHDSDKFILLLRKCVYPYEYMDDWEKFIEALSPEKEDFYGHLNEEDIIDAGYAHPKKVCKDFEIIFFWKILCFVCSKWYVIVSWCIWNFRKMCLQIYELDPAKFVWAPGLAWQSRFKKDKSKIRSFN